MILPRIKGNGFYFVILGCAVATIYFLVLTNVNLSTTVGYGNLSRKNYEYTEICREWKLALDQQKSVDSIDVPDEEDEPRLELEGLDYGFDLSSHFNCDNSYKTKRVSQRGEYYVIYNFVPADKEFGCTQSITLSAPGDYRFLDNVIPLVDRWQGPISIALYAPGHDFYTTMKSIAYLRNCETDLIKKLVTFHIFFDQEHTPKQCNGTSIFNSYEDSYDCSLPSPWEIANDEDMYKTQNSLLYPINVARNVAKIASQTYFVFPSDIELYPTRNFIQLFLKFVKTNMELFDLESRNVFVLPIFEVLEDAQVPENKTELQAMLKKKTAIIFHQSMCSLCHKVINSDKWVKAKETEGLGVFSVGKRIGRQMVWEPFFVCTQEEPLWDERMTWEGQNNKMVQAYTMCVMDYNFHVFDNAFLIHKPGVKKKKVQIQKFGKVVRKSSQLIKKISKEIQELYGYNPNCSTTWIPAKKKPPQPQPEDKKEALVTKTL